MQQVGIYNQLSKQLIEEIPPLKGTLAVQMLNGFPNPDEHEKVKQPMLYGRKQLLTQFKIRDPHAGKIVDVVLAEGWTADKQPTKAKCFVAGASEAATHFQGIFGLNEGIIEDEELYEILWLSPEREGSPFTDPRIPKTFKFLNKKEDNAKTINKVSNLKLALETASSMNDEKAKEFLRSLNLDVSEDKEDNKAKVLEYARMNVDTFLVRVKDEKLSSKAKIKLALEQSVLKFDTVTGALSTSTSSLGSLNTKVENFNVVDEIQAWMDSAANGSDIFKGVEKELKAKTK